MKKIILVVAILAFNFSNAQIKTNAGTFTKPTAGSIQVELSFSPNIAGASSTMFSLPNFYGSSIPGVKVRKFISENKAIRYTGNISVDNSGVQGETTQFIAAVGIGVENHMKGAERLSTYWGYEGNIGYQTKRATSGDIDNIDGTPKSTQIGVSAQAFTGFNYFIMPNIYLGCEINYGIAVLNTKADGASSITSVKIQPNVLSSLSLGWRF